VPVLSIVVADLQWKPLLSSIFASVTDFLSEDEQVLISLEEVRYNILVLPFSFSAPSVYHF